MYVFATPEEERDLDLVAFDQEFLDVIKLCLVVVLLDRDMEFDFLDGQAVLVLSRDPLLFGLFVPELAEIHNTADRWIRVRRYLDKIEALLSCH